MRSSIAVARGVSTAALAVFAVDDLPQELPNYGLTGWTCLIAPKGTPMSIRSKVANTWADVVKSPDMQALMEEQGMESYTGTPDETTRLIKASVEEFGTVIKVANITFQP